MYKKYKHEDLNLALASCQNGTMTAFKASKTFKVPYQTLLDNLKNSHPKPLGHASVLEKKEEEIIAQWIHHMAEMGFPVTKDQLLHSVGKLVWELKKENPFKDGIPGKHWYENFLKSNSNISSKVCQMVTSAQVGVTEDNIRQWFRSVNKYFEASGCLDALQDSSRIFSCVESAFYTCPDGQAVLERRGVISVCSRSKSNEKEILYLTLGASADGKLMPILAISPYKRIPTNILNKCPKTWVIAKSESGWVTCEIFYEYITNAFNNFLNKEKIKKPVVLFLDRHVSYLSLQLTTFCNENGIILAALFPNSTHALQPMEVAVFNSLKYSWTKSVHDWRIANNAQKLKKEDLAPILDKCIQKSLRPETIINGFRSSGLYPFDEDVFNYEKSNDSNTTESRSSTSTLVND